MLKTRDICRLLAMYVVVMNENSANVTNSPSVAFYSIFILFILIFFPTSQEIDILRRGSRIHLSREYFMMPSDPLALSKGHTP